eukprot:c14889_g1_i2.p2 GENE.c14889_g1_i2~~c14889_g1_i2.p2  ORF type:complete len:317 (+),score=76.94 c14889_g1_i2:49-951(+)
MAAAPEDAVDELFEVKNLFHLGCYQAAIIAAEGILRLSDDLKSEMNTLVYRAHLAKGNGAVVLREIKPTASLSLLAVRQLAVATQNTSMRAGAVEQAQKWLADSIASTNKTVRLVSALLFAQNDNVADALKVLHGSTDLEAMSLSVQLYLSIHRLDFAEKELKRMTEVDEDSTLTQLAIATVSLHRGKTGVQEAYNIFQDMIEKYQTSSKIAAGMAVCAMAQGQFTEAIAMLTDAREREGDSAQLLANLFVCYSNIPDAEEQCERALRQLAALDAAHPLVARLAAADLAFDAAAPKYVAA